MERGRYVEIATDRDDVICGGTVTSMDHYVASMMALLDAVPPDRIFVRYEWRDVSGGSPETPILNTSSTHGNTTTINTNRLLHDHELVHAAHAHAWPRSRRFLQEGLAVLFDSGNTRTQSPWPVGEVVDPLLEEDGVLDGPEYDKAWFLVSQIVRDHGMDGLRDFWYAVPADGSAEQVRQAYQDLFGRPIDTLIEPYEATEGGPLLDRWSCYFTICGDPQPWDGNTWQADGPFACADDPDALGPMGSSGTGTVERHHVVELEPGVPYRFTAAGGAGAHLRPCGLQCLPLGSPAHPFWPDMSSSRSDLPGGSYRVEILSAFEDLPTDTPGTFTIERLD